jgi:UDP-2,3-diacylglucosamine pyrophosphatase LpxH
MHEAGYDLIIISDPHLSEGWSEETCRISRNEDFFFDLSFRRFLEYLRKQDKKYRLIINGDFVDFLQVTSIPEGKEIAERKRRFGLGTTSAETVWKLGKIMNGHWIFFEALGEFLVDERGNEIYIIPGNHDIEFAIREVQNAFWEELVKYLPKEKVSQQDKVKERIKFLPWFYYDEKYSIYIEHGSQYDALNSFDYFLCPLRPDGTIDLPAGSFFVRYLFNKLELDYPFADNMKPVSRFMKWFLCRLYKPSYLRQLGTYISFFRETLNKASPVEKEWAKELKSRQEQILKDIADGYSLDFNKILCIKDMWVPSAIHNLPKHKLLCKFVTYSLPKDYWRGIARKIQEKLRVQFVIFGHTHEADLYVISRDGNKRNEYVNSGTWTKVFASSYEERLLKEENEFVYVHLREEVGKIKMELLRWNDSLGEGERVRLFEEKK